MDKGIERCRGAILKIIFDIKLSRIIASYICSRKRKRMFNN